MIPQTFRADSMLEALETIQKDLGPEALIISVRNIPAEPAWQVWKRQGVEVVAMPSAVGVPAKTNDGNRKQPLPANVPDNSSEQMEPPAAEPAAPKAADFQSILKKEAQTAKAPAKEKPLPESFTLLEERLLSQGVEPGFSRRIIRNAVDTLSPRAAANEKLVRDHVRQQLQVELRTREGLSLSSRRVICLIGTSGSGKTSTCAKIAASAAKTFGKRVTWVSADTLRAGSIAKTRALTDPLGIPLRLAYSPDELATMVDEEIGSDLVLVDMPGCNPYNEEELVEIGSFITTLANRQTLLVAPATARDTDLHDALSAFAPFDVKGMVITKMDETRSYGGAYNFARRSKLPILYFTTGARVLGDLLPAEASALAAAVLGEGMPR